MECEGCESRLAAALKRVDGVGEASADHSAGTVRVLFDPAGVYKSLCEWRVHHESGVAR